MSLSLISSRLQYVKTVHAVAEEFYNRASIFIIGMKAGNVDEIKKSLKDLQEILDFDITKVETITEYDILYERLQAVDIAMTRMINMCNNEYYNKLLLTDLSTGTYMDLRSRTESLKSLYTQFVVKSREDDINIFANAVKKFSDKEMRDYVYNASTNKFSNYIISALLEKGDDPKLIALIERQKDKLLDVRRVKLQFPISKCGFSLEPSTDKPPPGNKIILYHGNKSSITFDARGLIDAEYVRKNGLQTNPLAGINKAYIRRYNTIEKVTPMDHSVGVEVVTESDTKDPKFSVVSCVGKSTYRLLSDSGVTNHDVNRVSGFLKGYSTRSVQYNAACYATAVNNATRNKYAGIFNPNAGMYLREYKEFTDVFENTDKLKRDIIDYIIKRLPTKLSSYRELVNAISDSLAHVENAVAIYVTSQNKKPEHIITHAVRRAGIVKLFYSKMQYFAERDSIPKHYFANSDITITIARTYEKILQTAADELDKTHAWNIQLSYKEFLLAKNKIN